MLVCQEIIDDCAYFPTKQITHILPQGPLSEQSTANQQWQRRFTWWDVALIFPDHVTPSSCLFIGCLATGGGSGGSGVAWSWLAADTWEKTNSSPIAMEMSQQQVGGEGSRGDGYGAQADLL